MFSILLIEQNATLREIMCTFLRKNNYKVTTAFDAAEAQNHLEKHYIDMLVVDIDTTRMANDLEFLKELEILDYNLPAFAFLSATDIKTKAACYEYGADGVLPKPIDYEDFHLIIKSILRCSKKASSHIIQFGDTTINYSSLSVSYITEKKNEMVMLPPKEFYLLYTLLRSPNRIFTRTQLMDEIWDYDCESGEKTVNTHINRLRKKFKNNKDFEIITIKNLGYKAVLNNISAPPPRIFNKNRGFVKSGPFLINGPDSFSS